MAADSLVCIYARTSASEPEEVERALRQQMRVAQRWCADHRAKTMMAFVDAGGHGAESHRPGLAQMLALAAQSNPPFNLILAHSAPRLFRDGGDLERCEAKLARNGVRVEFVEQPLSSSGLYEFAIGQVCPFGGEAR